MKLDIVVGDGRVLIGCYHAVSSQQLDDIGLICQGSEVNCWLSSFRAGSAGCLQVRLLNRAILHANILSAQIRQLLNILRVASLDEQRFTSIKVWHEVYLLLAIWGYAYCRYDNVKALDLQAGDNGCKVRRDDLRLQTHTCSNRCNQINIETGCLVGCGIDIFLRWIGGITSYSQCTRSQQVVGRGNRWRLGVRCRHRRGSSAATSIIPTCSKQHGHYNENANQGHAYRDTSLSPS